MITELTIPDEAAVPFGLAGASLRGLGKVVLLAGPNGSGKTRYLRLIRKLAADAAETRPSDAAVAERLEKAHLAREAARVQLVQKQTKEAIIKLETAERRLDAANEAARIHDAITSYVTFDLNPAGVPWLTGDDQPTPPLVDPRQMPPALLEATFGSVQQTGLMSPRQATPAYLTALARTLSYATSPDIADHPHLADELPRARDFNLIVRALLGTEVGYEHVPGLVVPTLFGRIFASHELSSGQKELIAWAIMLHAQGATLGGSIVFLDEPENHLHPKACIDAIQRLEAAVGPGGQVWIATHSIALVAERGLGDLYHVQDGRIAYANTKATAVLASLLGGDEGRENMLAMLRDAEVVAGAAFLAECFEAPGVVDTIGPDRQKNLLQEALAHVVAADRPLKVLDYGAGKGRLATAIATSQAHRKVRYFALNDGPCTPADAEACKKHIADLEQGAGDFYWDDAAKLLATERAAFDVVVLSNVLHEIHPDKWKQTFDDIHDLLTPEGVVLIMEDLLPPIGELAHHHGFLMLDHYGLRELFAEQTIAPVRQSDDGRLSVVAVARSSLKGLTRDTKRVAIEYVQRSARKRVETLRSAGERTAKAGREHAHYLVQFASASLALGKE